VRLGEIEHLTDAQKDMISKKLADATTFIEGVKKD
jgi:hypothetical protein